MSDSGATGRRRPGKQPPTPGDPIRRRRGKKPPTPGDPVRHRPGKQPPTPEDPIRRCSGKQPPTLRDPVRGRATFRILCPSSKVGAVIGKSGKVVKLIHSETGAFIRATDPSPGCNESVIHITGPDSPSRPIQLSPDSEPAEGSPAQEALVRVYSKILDLGGWEVAGTEVECRLVSPPGYAKKIEKIRGETGARIGVLARANLPVSASGTDKIVQILGDPLAVKKALLAVSHCLQETFTTDYAQMPLGNAPTSVPQGNALTDPNRGYISPASSSLASSSEGPSGYPEAGHSYPAPMEKLFSREQKVTFRLLCSIDKVGGVIGKNGKIIKSLEIETGTSISCGPVVAGSEECVITISALETSELRDSPTQNAVIRVFSKSMRGRMRGEKEDKVNCGPVSLRLLILPSQVGSLMGKEGTLISQLRKATGTGIRILSGDKVPKCAAENDEVVQINGKLENVTVALLHVTGRLRDNIFSFRPLNNGAPSSASTAPITASYHGCGEPSVPGQYSSFASLDLDYQTTLAHNMSHLGLSDANGYTTMHGDWEAVGNGSSTSSTTVSEVELPQSQINMDFGSLTKTTLEIAVPTHSLESVYGENGSNLSRIKQISGAEIVVHGQPTGKNEGLVIIAGTHDQTEVAQSLLQAFILAGQASVKSN